MTTHAATDSRRVDVPWWLPTACLVLAVIGIGVATYLTIAHFDEHVQLACSDTGTINCAKVTTSSESHFLGMPVAVLGLAFFVGAPVLFVPAAWRSTLPLIRWARVAAVSIGMLFVLWLIYAELIRIHNICLYCTAVHVITFLLFALVLVGTVITTPYDDFDDLDSDLED
jgi:uncharacterized membrane protein